VSISAGAAPTADGIDWLQLRDFRNMSEVEVRFAPGGLTVVLGDNGAGKTSLLEGVAYIATQHSLRGAAHEALVRVGQERAFVRGETTRATRTMLVEIEIPSSGSDRVQLNKRRITRADDLTGALLVTVFSPDDLVLVKGSPSHRRGYLDDVLAACSPRGAGLRRDVERVLRQRSTLLHQAKGRLSADVETTLDVWDGQLASLGELLVQRREEVAAELEPVASEAFSYLTGAPASLRFSYRRSWSGSLADALLQARQDDVRRAVTTVGPHRDDLDLLVGNLDARTRLSQGRQRCVTLALRLASHQVVTTSRSARPVLLLDDAFSELDPRTASALVETLPRGQAILTTASSVPPAAEPAQIMRIAGGSIV
jgi:DNA replication and repair protein RecF